MLLLLLQAHVQFQIVTPRTLSAFTSNTLVLPDVRVLNDRNPLPCIAFSTTLERAAVGWFSK
jgi:hypothetical protein